MPSEEAEGSATAGQAAMEPSVASETVTQPAPAPTAGNYDLSELSFAHLCTAKLNRGFLIQKGDTTVRLNSGDLILIEGLVPDQNGSVAASNTIPKI